MVNAPRRKYSGNAVNKTTYRTDGSDVRDATAEEKLRYLDANKHKRKKAVEAVSSGEQSGSSTAVVSGDLSKTRSVSIRDERGGGDASSGDRSGNNQKKDKDRVSSGKGGERESLRQKEGRESERSRRTAVTAVEEEPNKEEADRQILAETQSRIEARRATRDIETAHATIRKLRESHSIASAAPDKPARAEQERDKKDGGKKPAASRVSKKASGGQTVTEAVVAKPFELTGGITTELTSDGKITVIPQPKRPRSGKRATERTLDDVLSTLKFTPIVESRPRDNEFAEDASNVELGISLVASALRRTIPNVSSATVMAGMSDCFVELTSTRKKGKASVSAAPPNSVDSEDLWRKEDDCEVRLSQSDVYVGLPEDGSVSTVAEELAIRPEIPAIPSTERGDEALELANAMSYVAANEEVGDEPAAPGEVATPLLYSADSVDGIAESPGTPQSLVKVRAEI